MPIKKYPAFIQDDELHTLGKFFTSRAIYTALLRGNTKLASAKETDVVDVDYIKRRLNALRVLNAIPNAIIPGSPVVPDVSDCPRLSEEEKFALVMRTAEQLSVGSSSPVIRLRAAKLILDEVHTQNEIANSRIKQVMSSVVGVLKIYKSCIVRLERMLREKGYGESLIEMINQSVKEEAVKNPVYAAILSRYEFGYEIEDDKNV